MAVILAALDDDWVRAGASLGIAVALAVGVHHFLAVRAHRIAELVARGQLSPEVDTRLRFLRRFVAAAILLIGITVAFGLDGLAGSLLTSGAIGAAVIGFAARQTLANLVAGIMLAITQPVRVGDWVVFEDVRGEVEDVRLSYTLLRTGSDHRILIPNERIAAGVLRNETLVSSDVDLEVSVWIPPGADSAAALAALGRVPGAKASLTEATPQGIRLTVAGERVPAAQRVTREARLREASVAALHEAGLLAGFGPAQPNG